MIVASLLMLSAMLWGMSAGLSLSQAIRGMRGAWGGFAGSLVCCVILGGMALHAAMTVGTAG